MLFIEISNLSEIALNTIKFPDTILRRNFCLDAVKASLKHYQMNGALPFLDTNSQPIETH